MRIWKTELQPVDVQEIIVPQGAEMLCARDQHEKICVWYRCDPDNTLERDRRTIAIVGTGNPAPSSEGRYLGSAFLQGGALVFHVFERIH